jgi:hypothetical protein
MNTMKMPGFTAEVSLYKAINHYHMIAAIHQADGTVHAAQFGPAYLICFRRCFRACIAGGGSGGQCSEECRSECTDS